MLTEQELYQQLEHVLTKTNFSFLGEKYEGKVRDNYVEGKTRYLITTDRLSCFDVVLTSIPFKGQVLNELATHWFELSKNIISNHLIDIPHPNVMKVRNCEVLPVEIIVRAYLSGSAWRDYVAGRPVSGIQLPEGLRSCEKLPELLITPSTKAAQGSHDMPISENEILAKGLVSAAIWNEARETSLALFKLGTAEAKKAGLILVDTKYEFGLLDGKLVLVDEIHTIDSSRYWVEATYNQKFISGEPPEMLDKEPIRQWLLSKGYSGNGPAPEFTDAHRIQLAQHYISSYERIVQKPFNGVVGSVETSMRAALGR